MIPRDEFNRLLSDIQRAVGCATIGGLVAGYDLLLDGLKRAQYARMEGEEWAHELVARYQVAITEFQHFYGLRLG